MDFLGDLQSGIGNIAKAFLVVRYYNYEEVSSNPQKAKANARKKARAAMIKKEKDVVKAAEKKLKSKTSPSKALSATGFGTTSKNPLPGGLKKTGNYTTFTVQYNPSSLKFSTVGGEQKFFGRQGMGQVGEGIVSSVNSPIMTTLRFKLIFECVDPMDAFIRESEDITGAVSSIGNVAGAAKNIYDKAKNNSHVKNEVEALLGAALSDYTRDMIFVFGGIVFHGVLTGCNANYKMFNKAGDPIYAEVDMTMKQAANETYDNDRWLKAFDDYFGNGSISMDNKAVKKATKKLVK